MMTLGAVYSGAPSPVGAKDANSVICGTSKLSRVNTLGVLCCTFIDTSGDVLVSMGVCRLHTHTVCGVIGDDNPFSNPEDQTKAVDRAIQVALSGIVKLNERA